MRVIGVQGKAIVLSKCGPQLPSCLVRHVQTETPVPTTGLAQPATRSVSTTTIHGYSDNSFAAPVRMTPQGFHAVLFETIEKLREENGRLRQEIADRNSQNLGNVPNPVEKGQQSLTGAGGSTLLDGSLGLYKELSSQNVRLQAKLNKYQSENWELSKKYADTLLKMKGLEQRKTRIPTSEQLNKLREVAARIKKDLGSIAEQQKKDSEKTFAAIGMIRDLGQLTSFYETRKRVAEEKNAVEVELKKPRLGMLKSSKKQEESAEKEAELTSEDEDKLGNEEENGAEGVSELSRMKKDLEQVRKDYDHLLDMYMRLTEQAALSIRDRKKSDAKLKKVKKGIRFMAGHVKEKLKK